MKHNGHTLRDTPRSTFVGTPFGCSCAVWCEVAAFPLLGPNEISVRIHLTRKTPPIPSKRMCHCRQALHLSVFAADNHTHARPHTRTPPQRNAMTRRGVCRESQLQQSNFIWQTKAQTTWIIREATTKNDTRAQEQQRAAQVQNSSSNHQQRTKTAAKSDTRYTRKTESKRARTES